MRKQTSKMESTQKKYEEQCFFFHCSSQRAMVKVNGQMVAVNGQSQMEAVKVNGQMAAFKG